MLQVFFLQVGVSSATSSRIFVVLRINEIFDHVVIDVEMLVLVMEDLDQPELQDGAAGADEGVPDGRRWGRSAAGCRVADEDLNFNCFNQFGAN